MRLEEICTQIIWEGELDGETYQLSVAESSWAKGGLITSVLSKAPDFVKKSQELYTKNRGLAVATAGLALAAFIQYQENKRNTVKLFAKNTAERRQYQKMVDDMMKTGNYKKITDKNIGGGYLWELRKK